ncbi:MAG: hypothetical protein COT28_00820 [Methylobacterium sp. CG08_land_8_20_14_0_20_71_15]|nr:MAG: hypothetical protein COT56_12675 [Methylobacterium sp. CG09_land_8_20_14_0_10_71_15]PIU16333.1 MAG: hypothetical protein COT28_00820 [Methylobacterium sp. CG08_land_8_20_14_0_20_71_15]
MKVLGKRFDMDLWWGSFSVTLGRLIEVLYSGDDGTRGHQWFDWLDHGNGYHEVWLGRRYLSFTWGPTWERARSAA